MLTVPIVEVVRVVDADRDDVTVTVPLYDSAMA